MEEKIKKIVRMATTYGIDAFILMIKNKNMQTIHFEKTTIKDAMTMMIAGMHQVIAMELEKHPEYSPEYRNIHTNLADNLNELIKKTNEELINFKKNK